MDILLVLYFNPQNSENASYENYSNSNPCTGGLCNWTEFTEMYFGCSWVLHRVATTQLAELAYSIIKCLSTNNITQKITQQRPAT